LKLEEKTVEVISNITYDESIRVGIADDDLAVSLIIEKLIDAYKNPYRAALREYTSNAYDEHLQAGVNVPVEVSLPSSLAPVLKVQDFGRGLTRDELKGFGTIGVSSKRDSNDTTGGFGMGSKVGLAASPQFTVVSIKDGKRNTVIVARDENNVPHMNFLEEADTTDPSGTTIVVPISDVTKFGNLDDFWVGWPVGSILIDDEAPKRSIHDPNKFQTVKGGIAYNDKSNIAAARDEIRIVINQVYYSLPAKDLTLNYQQQQILKYYILRLDNGSVDIHSSRESLIVNARTKAALDARVKQVLGLAAEIRREEVKSAQTLKTALSLLNRLRNDGYPTDGLKFNGLSLVLPGDVIKGNVVPDPEGTWAIPHRDYNSASGYRVDKNFRPLSSREVWRYTDDSKFVIVHSAGQPTAYGKHRNRKAHREAHGVGEWLSVQSNGRASSWNVFVTSDPIEKMNRIYRELADVILTADEFNATVTKVRSEKAKAAREAAKANKAAKVKDTRLNVVSYANYGSVSTNLLSVEDIKNQGYKYTVILRNQAGGMEQRIREGFATKAHYRSDMSDAIGVLRTHYNVAIILANKNDDLDDIIPALPPQTTFHALAMMRLEETRNSVSEVGRRAVYDRENRVAPSVLHNMAEVYTKDVKNETTREWLDAMRDYRDTASIIRRTLRWFTYDDLAVKKLMEELELAANGGAGKMVPSPSKRYPLISGLNYNAEHKDIVHYINMIDDALDKANKKAKKLNKTSPLKP